MDKDWANLIETEHTSVEFNCSFSLFIIKIQELNGWFLTGKILRVTRNLPPMNTYSPPKENILRYASNAHLLNHQIFVKNANYFNSSFSNFCNNNNILGRGHGRE